MCKSGLYIFLYSLFFVAKIPVDLFFLYNYTLGFGVRLRRIVIDNKMLPILTNRQKLDNIKILVVKSLPTANLKIVTKPLTSLEAQNLYQAKTLGRIHIELYKIKINHHGKIPNE